MTQRSKKTRKKTRNKEGQKQYARKGGKERKTQEQSNWKKEKKGKRNHYEYTLYELFLEGEGSTKSIYPTVRCIRQYVISDVNNECKGSVSNIGKRYCLELKILPCRIQKCAPF